MKRILFGILAVSLLLQNNVFAEAVNVTFDKGRSELKLSGELGTEMAHADVAAIITELDLAVDEETDLSDKVLDVIQTRADANGKYDFGIFSTGDREGMCRIYVTANKQFVSKSAVELVLTDSDKILQFLSDIKGTENDMQMLEIIDGEEKVKRFNADMTFYSQIEKNRSTVAKNLFKNKARYSDFEQEGEERIKAINAFDDDFFKYSYLSFLSEKQSAHYIKDTLDYKNSGYSDNYKEKIKTLLGMDTLLGTDERTSLGKTIDAADAAGKLEISEMVSKFGFDDENEFAESVKISIINYCIKHASNWNKCAEILMTHKDYLPGLNTEKLAAAANNQELMSQIVQRYDWKSCKELVDYVNLITQNNTPNNNQNGSGGGTSNGGTSGSASGNFSVPKNNTQSSSVIFSDMEGTEWAIAAVERLSRLGIVSGVGNNKFEPNRTVRREEFVKMLMDGLGYGKSDKNVFADVDNDAWYAGYVSGAYESKIVSGMEDGNFGIGRNITRQDMVVMAYRAMMAKNPEFAKECERTTDFRDFDAISDYAREAVTVMSGIDVISGTGDNMFNPHISATRAQAAVFIEKLLTFAKLI